MRKFRPLLGLPTAVHGMRKFESGCMVNFAQTDPT